MSKYAEKKLGRAKLYFGSSIDMLSLPRIKLHRWDENVYALLLTIGNGGTSDDAFMFGIDITVSPRVSQFLERRLGMRY